MKPAGAMWAYGEESGVGPRLILIDGYNVIRKTPGLAIAERFGLAAGRDALLTQVVATYRHTPHRVVVVFDGDGPVESVASLLGRARGQVIFTARGMTADARLDTLAREARSRGETVTVVSEDLAVRLDASAAGASSARPQELATRLNAPSRDVAKRAQHRAAVRAQLEARDSDIGAPGRGGRGSRRGTRKPGNPRRAPRRQRREPDEPVL